MKKFTYLLIVLMANFVLFSCEQKESEKNEVKNEGYIQCTNISSDPYFVSISGPTSTTISVPGKGVQTVTVKPGYYSVEVTQQSGYILYPTKQTFTGTVSLGKTQIVVFPQ